MRGVRRRLLEALALGSRAVGTRLEYEESRDAAGAAAWELCCRVAGLTSVAMGDRCTCAAQRADAYWSGDAAS